METENKKAGSVRVGRVVILFVYCFGCIIVPVLGAMIYFFSLDFPDPYLPDSAKLRIDAAKGLFLAPEKVLGTEDWRSLPAENRFGATAGVSGRVDGGCRVTVLASESADSLAAVKRAVRDSLDYTSVSSTPGETWYTLKDPERMVLLMSVGNYVLVGEGEMRNQVRQALEELPVFIRNPEAAAFDEKLNGMIPSLAIVLLLYCFLQIFIWPRLASWAAKVPPAAAEPLSPEELKRRLLAMNEMDLPFQVREGKRGRSLFFEWKYADARWGGLFAAAGLHSVYSLKLRLPKNVNDRRVRTLDRSYGVRWDAGTGKGVLSAGFAASFFRGINFAQYEKGFVCGLVNENGRLTLKPYEWCFNMQEIKNPVIEIVTGAGYEFFPVVTFNWLING